METQSMLFLEGSKHWGETFKSVGYKITHGIASYITIPFKSLYMRGPSFLGCWEGKTMYEICSSMTGTNKEVWENNTEQCIIMISNRMDSLVIFGGCVIYTIILWKIISKCTDGVFGLFSRKPNCAIVLATDVLRNPHRAYISS